MNDSYEPNELIYQLKITLDRIPPPIWRRVLVPARYSLYRLHQVIQIAMGWEDYHLHQFELGEQRYGVPDPDDEPIGDERRIKLHQAVPEVKARFRYIYDFGDWWEHTILVEKILPPDPTMRYPVCTAGRRAGPPEDVGGVWGYAEFLEAIVDPANERHDEFLDWIGGSFDPEAFDQAGINDELKRLGRAVPSPKPKKAATTS